MPKKMIDPQKYGSPTYCAELVSQSRTTLVSAVSRGEIEFVDFACGTRMWEIASVKKWVAIKKQRKAAQLRK